MGVCYHGGDRARERRESGELRNEGNRERGKFRKKSKNEREIGCLLATQEMRNAECMHTHSCMQAHTHTYPLSLSIFLSLTHTLSLSLSRR